MRISRLLAALASAAIFVAEAQAKTVFAHYMVGSVTQAHAQTDIDNAISMGLDGFALNIGDPTQPFVSTTLSYLYSYAAGKNFKMFVSLDMYASVGAGKGLDSYYPILSGYLGHTAYYRGPNGFPFLSTFSYGSLTNTQWLAFKQTYANQLYFVPDFDGTQDYYQNSADWWAYWGSVVDGLFSWESAWPNVGASNVGDVSLDNTVIAGTSARGKTYMMAVSALQYKNAYGTNLFRQGGLNLVQKMQNILTMSIKPDFVQIITWNDGPESHYIGNIWPESNSDAAPAKYATQAGWPHNAWQPLVTSFIKAYKAGTTSASMVPASGIAVGAIWYKDIMQSAVCPSDTKPAGFSTGADSLKWSLVLATGATGYTVKIISNGVVIQNSDAYAGLNMGNPGGVQPGSQVMQLLDSAGAVVMTASGGSVVSSGCPDGIYNMNFQVVGLK